MNGSASPQPLETVTWTPDGAQAPELQDDPLASIAEPETVAEPETLAEPETVAEPEPESAAEPEPGLAVAVVEPETEPEPAPTPSFIERGRIRRRARHLRALREIQLRDLGGFLVELERFGRERPDLVRVKLGWALQTDSELRALERALGVEEPLREIRQAGIGGACEHCGAVHGSSDHYCATCGEPLHARVPGLAATHDAE